MKNYYFLIFAFLFFYQNINAQDFEKTKGSLGVYIMPQTFIYYNPRLRMGLVYRNNHDVAVGIDFEIGNHLFDMVKPPGSYWTNNYKFFSIRPEVKFYFYKQTEMYFGLEFFYMRMKDIFKDDFFHTESITISYQSAKFQKYKLGGLINIGKKFIEHDHLDIYVITGIGLAYMSKTYTDIEASSSSTFLPRESFKIDHYRLLENRLLFHFSYGLKIGWKFWIKK